MIAYILLIILLLISAYVTGVYNTVLTTQIHSHEKWILSENLLKQRHQLVTRLLTLIHQKNKPVNSVQTARNLAAGASGNTVQKEQYENTLSGALGILIDYYNETPLSENEAYCALKADLAQTEKKIQEAIMAHNRLVAQFNQSIEKMPNRWIVKHTHIQPERTFLFEKSIN